MNKKFENPFIAFKKSDKSFHFYQNEENLALCSYQAFKKGYFKDLIIYTLNGKAYRIANAKVKKYRLSPLIDWLLFSPTVELLFEFEEVSNDMSFDSFKKKLIEFFKKSEYFYNVGIRQDIIKKVAEANSHYEFVEIFKFIH